MKNLLLLLCLLISSRLFAQKDIILHKDSLFWQAYNAGDAKSMMVFIAPDVEFYHDNGGITLGLANLEASLENGLFHNLDSFRVRREVVPGSVEVYPMSAKGKIYGAIISGRHLFYDKMAGKPEYLAGQARFTHLWLLKDGEWKMTRILSYDHKAVPYENKRTAIDLPQATLQRYVGTYVGPQTGTVNIVVDSGKLQLKTSNGSFVLFAEKENLFFSGERDLTFEFTGDGKMIVRENGAVAETLSVAR
jgi:hypothetical protein